jgi:hypothetical protein
MKKIDYRLEKIADQTYHLIIPDQYDMCMVFWRVQEFYESPFKEVRGKNITLLEFMDIYSKRKGGGCFTYPVEWGGFNVPNKMVEDCYNQKVAHDYNHYDSVIIDIHEEIKKTDDKYYLIGTTGSDFIAMKHELAHAFYYLDSSYKKEVNQVLKKIPDKYYKKIVIHLKNIGYTNNVIQDEIHAYLSTRNGHFWDEIKPNKTLLKIEEEVASIFAKYEKSKNVG